MKLLSVGIGHLFLGAAASMSKQMNARQEQATFGAHCHPSCIVCGTQNQGSMQLRFQVRADGGVEAPFACDTGYQGYPDRLHGGVVAMLLDAAMTHCLFARNVRAVTARLGIRYRMPVILGIEAFVRARIVRETPPLYTMEAEIVQDGQVCAAAEAKFLESLIADNEGDTVPAGQ